MFAQAVTSSHFLVAVTPTIPGAQLGPFLQSFVPQSTSYVAVATHPDTLLPLHCVQQSRTQLLQRMEPHRTQRVVAPINALHNFNNLSLPVQAVPVGHVFATAPVSASTVQNLPSSTCLRPPSNVIICSLQHNNTHKVQANQSHEHFHAVLQPKPGVSARSPEINSEMRSRKRKLSDPSPDHIEEDSQSRNKTVMKRRKPVSATSKYRGVSWHRRDQRWIARAWVNGKICSVGSFKSEVEAAQAVEARYIKEYGIDGASDLQKIVPEDLSPYVKSNPPRSLNEAMIALKAVESVLSSCPVIESE